MFDAFYEWVPKFLAKLLYKALLDNLCLGEFAFHATAPFQIHNFTAACRVVTPYKYTNIAKYITEIYKRQKFFAKKG